MAIVLAAVRIFMIYHAAEYSDVLDRGFLHLFHAGALAWIVLFDDSAGEGAGADGLWWCGLWRLF